MNPPPAAPPLQTLQELQDNFALPGLLSFEADGELLRAQITLPTGDATIYLYGAHLTHWQPAGHAPVLFLSERSDFAPGKAIRGGIPVCFPWFGPDTQARAAGKAGPAHGFARIQPWNLAFAALAGDALHLTFTLAPTELSRSLGFDAFRVAYELVFGGTTPDSEYPDARTPEPRLILRFTVANTGQKPITVEEALHTYFAVGDVRQSPISGLESATFLDKTDAMAVKTGPDTPLTLTSWTDRVYPANTAPTVIEDRANARTLTLDKTHSATTVVWNPYPEASATMQDLAPGAWTRFLCVETANTGTDALTLAPGQAHTMQLILKVENL